MPLPDDDLAALTRLKQRLRAGDLDPRGLAVAASAPTDSTPRRWARALTEARVDLSARSGDGFDIGSPPIEASAWLSLDLRWRAAALLEDSPLEPEALRGFARDVVVRVAGLLQERVSGDRRLDVALEALTRPEDHEEQFERAHAASQELLDELWAHGDPRAPARSAAEALVVATTPPGRLRARTASHADVLLAVFGESSGAASYGTMAREAARWAVEASLRAAERGASDAGPWLCVVPAEWRLEDDGDAPSPEQLARLDGYEVEADLCVHLPVVLRGPVLSARRLRFRYDPNTGVRVGHVEYTASRALSPEELDQLEDFTRGQLLDGVGEDLVCTLADGAVLHPFVSEAGSVGQVRAAARQACQAVAAAELAWQHERLCLRLLGCLTDN